MKHLKIDQLIKIDQRNHEVSQPLEGPRPLSEPKVLTCNSSLPWSSYLRAVRQTFAVCMLLSCFCSFCFPCGWFGSFSLLYFGLSKVPLKKVHYPQKDRYFTHFDTCLLKVFILSLLMFADPSALRSRLSVESNVFPQATMKNEVSPLLGAARGNLKPLVFAVRT